MSRILILTVAALQLAVLANCDGIYSVNAPGTIRPLSDYSVSVSIFKADTPCTIKVGIIGPEFSDSKNVEVQPQSTETVVFNVPSLKTGDYNVTAEGVSGITFKNTTKLNFGESINSVFIQTDKATYKPGDLVRFRVLFLDENTRPATLKSPVDVIVNDASQNRIKQLKNVEFKNSVYSGELQLSEFPVLGNWEIKIFYDGQSVKSKNFEIAKYVLPKFEVSVETPANIAIDDGSIRATIRSKYTYGKPVKGKATITVKPAYRSWGSDKEITRSEKTVDIDGKAFVEFNLKNDLQLDFKTNNHYYPPMEIFAEVEEELTGLKQNATANVNLHYNKFSVEGFENPYNFFPGQPIKIKVVVKKYDGSPVRDDKNMVSLTAEVPRYAFLRSNQNETEEEKPVDLKFESKLNENGIAEFDITFPSSNVSFYSLKANYLNIEGYVGSISKYEEKTGEYFTLEVETKKPKLGKDVTIVLSSNKPIDYFFYHVTGRGNIIMSQKIKVPADSTTHSFKITPTFAMIPYANILVTLVRGSDLIFEETTVNFNQDLPNHIEIDAPKEAKPGEDIKLKVTTTPNSYVGLLGVDQSVLLLKSGNDLSKTDVFNSLREFSTTTPWIGGWGRYPGMGSGLVTLTNANFPYNERRKYFFGAIPGSVGLHGVPGSPGIPLMMKGIRPMAASMGGKASASIVGTPAVRKEFPESWIWANIITNADNEISIEKKVPDTITSWVITGFSLNEKTGLGITDEASKLRVFQPFFVSVNLPYSVKRGEVFSVPVIVFNYLEKNLDVEVTFDNADNEFDFTEATNDIEENVIEGKQRTKEISVPANSGKTLKFMIRPNKIGQISLKITAKSPLAGDAIIQMLRVEPEGVTEFVNKALLLNLNEKSEQSEKIEVEIPEDAVSDSEYVEVSVVGDLLGPTIKNLDKLIRKPYGCGEQNMVNFVPNILVLEYLTSIDQLTPRIEEKAKKFLEIGYQRELTYKHDDGSYSAFGKSDKSGSTWLTAYVARSFHQAMKFTDIDPKIIEQALDFLVKSQEPSGQYKEVGKIIDHAHSSAEDKGVTLTAFVLLAFLENQNTINKYQESVTKGLNYLAENIANTDTVYPLAIATYALVLAKHEAAEKALPKLESMATKEGDLKSWNVKSDTSDKYYGPKTYNVEVTGYALLAFADKQSAGEMLPIIKYLISQRNSNGGFDSTQDTVVGLQALTEFSKKAGSGKANMKIELDDKSVIDVNEENSLLLQTHILPQKTRQVNVNAKGKGTCLLQVSYRYNMATKEDKPGFIVKPLVKDSTNANFLNLQVCASYNAAKEEIKQSNMAIMEISLPSGYTVDSDGFPSIEAVENVMKLETKNDDSVLIIYFDSVKEKETCFDVVSIKSHAVAKQKPASIVLYDYYDNTKIAKEYYSIKSSLCDICSGDDCGKACEK